jgi:hypothetical protein
VYTIFTERLQGFLALAELQAGARVEHLQIVRRLGMTSGGRTIARENADGKRKR